MMKLSGNSIYAKARVEAFGAFPESLVNMAASNGIELENVRRINGNTLEFVIYERDIDELKHLAAKCSVELTLEKYRDKSRRLLKKRFALLPLALTVVLLLLCSSLFIWQIEIHGINSLSHGEVLSVLEDSGLCVGSFWPTLKSDEIRSRAMLKMPQIGWMTVNISGSRAVVLINERVDKPEIYDESEAADLVASKTGLIRRVSVLQGRALAEPGQAVAVGETLASGSLVSIMGRERAVRSKGSVMADTWYEIDSVCPEEMNIKSPGVLTRHRFALVFGKRRINFYFSSGKAIDECDKIINDYTLGIDGQFALPIRFVHERIVPYGTQPGQGYDSDRMAEHLQTVLQHECKGQILQSSLTESCMDGLYVLTLRAHCVENIAETRELAG